LKPADDKRPRELTYEEYLALFGPLLPSKRGERSDPYKDGQEAARTVVTRSELGATESKQTPKKTRSE
jgi:hypothetical protein